MKKLISLTLAVMMLCSSLTAFAEEAINTQSVKERTEEYEKWLEKRTTMGETVQKTTETYYGTIVETSKLEMSTTGANVREYITYLRYDGAAVGLSQYAPDKDDLNKMKYEKLEISEDGKWATITYPELKNTGTFVTVIDLENCTAKKEIIPYKEPTDKKPEETMEDEETASGMCEGYFWVDENSRPEATVSWEYSKGTLTIGGEGHMHDFYFTYGGRVQQTTTIGKPWKKYYDKIKKVVIKEGVNSVSRYAFVDCKNLEEVIIGDNVTINREAFDNLRNLEKLTLGKNCTLGERAFVYCTALKSVTLTEGTEVNTGVFANCSALGDISFEGSGISIANSAFTNTPLYDKIDTIYVNNELLWIKNAREITSYTIPEGTTRIGGFLFQHGKIEEIILPESMVEIGKAAFKMSDLRSITLNEGLKKIDAEAFYASKLGGVSLPESLEYVGKKAFRYTYITDVIIRKNLTVEDGDKNDGGAFSDCDNLQYVTIEDGVQRIANGMFADCYRLENITLPDSVKVIGAQAFEGCYRLPEGIIGKGLVEIGSYALSSCNGIITADISHVEKVGEGVFDNCKSLEKVVLNENMTKIPHSFFDGCTKLKEVVLPKNITAIENYAFRGTESLTGEFVIPESVTSVGEWAFEGSGFSGIVFPESVAEVGIGALRNMKSLTKVALSESITKIPPKAFEGATMLATVNIPPTVTEIGYEAFCGCESLNEISLPGAVSQIGYNAFKDCKKLESITLPEGVSGIPAGLFKNCVSLKNVDVTSENITDIGNEAFFGCEKLNEIKLPDTVLKVGRYIFTNSGIYNNPIYWEDGIMYVSGCVVAVSAGGDCVKIKEGTRAIAPNAFGDCNIPEIHVPGSVKTIGTSAFEKSGTKKFVLNEGTEIIEGYAFSYCGVETINLPDSLLRIATSAFSGCDKIKELVIPAKVDIRPMAFESHNACLEKLVFKEGREEIDPYSEFGYHCTVKEVVLPDGLKKIGDIAFSGWKNLEKIKIPDTVTEIGERAFSDCDKLISISIPKVETIGKGAFKGCDRLEKVTLGENAVIAEEAFSECPVLVTP